MCVRVPMAGAMATDPRGLRPFAPLLDAWLRFQEESPRPFTIPGHKHRTDLVGDVIAGDVPYYAGLDTMKLAHGVLLDAQARAAALWGAEHAWFSVGGSTHGNQGIALALGQPGEKVIVARTLHRSMLLALVLAGLEPVWVTPRVDQAGMPRGVHPDDLAQALAEHPRSVGVLIGDPSYLGTVGDVAGLVEVAHGHGPHGIPIAVDAAWAAHFGSHPDLPPHATSQGADLVVMSAHKTLPAWSQAAIVLAQGDRIDVARLAAGLDATATTSPAGAILASIDAARALLERHGAELLATAMDLVTRARTRLAQIPGVEVLHGAGVDPLKLVIDLRGSGADGLAVEQDLLHVGHPLELADRDLLVAMVTLADDEGALTSLTQALSDAIERHRGTPRTIQSSGIWDLRPVQRMSPRAAFFAPRRAVPIQEAIGRICGELIAPYPPGIPVLAPGEEVTRDAVNRLQAARSAGARIAYAADPALATLVVVEGC
jgi:lysine decarboxylase